MALALLPHTARKYRDRNRNRDHIARTSSTPHRHRRCCSSHSLPARSRRTRRLNRPDTRRTAGPCRDCLHMLHRQSRPADSRYRRNRLRGGPERRRAPRCLRHNRAILHHSRDRARHGRQGNVPADRDNRALRHSRRRSSRRCRSIHYGTPRCQLSCSSRVRTCPVRNRDRCKRHSPVPAPRDTWPASESASDVGPHALHQVGTLPRPNRPDRAGPSAAFDD